MESTLKSYPAEMPWTIARNQLFAIAAQELREMVIMPEIAEVPDTPEYVRGVINLRGHVIPLLDLRKRMGLTSAVEETESCCALMQQREQDHRNWLNGAGGISQATPSIHACHGSAPLHCRQVV